MSKQNSKLRRLTNSSLAALVALVALGAQTQLSKTAGAQTAPAVLPVAPVGSAPVAAPAVPAPKTTLTNPGLEPPYLPMAAKNGTSIVADRTGEIANGWRDDSA